MTDAEFRAFVAQARAEVDAELARLDTLDWESMAPDERAMEELRRGYTELRDSMADEAIAAEMQATPGWTQPAGLLLLAFPLVRDALTLRAAPQALPYVLPSHPQTGTHSCVHIWGIVVQTPWPSLVSQVPMGCSQNSLDGSQPTSAMPSQSLHMAAGSPAPAEVARAITAATEMMPNDIPFMVFLLTPELPRAVLPALLGWPASSTVTQLRA